MRLPANSVWQCPCGAYVPMGKACPVCGGNTHVEAPKVPEQSKQPEQPEQPKTAKRKRKYREPAKEEGLLKSFLFKKGDK